MGNSFRSAFSLCHSSSSVLVSEIHEQMFSMDDKSGGRAGQSNSQMLCALRKVRMWHVALHYLFGSRHLAGLEVRMQPLFRRCRKCSDLCSNLHWCVLEMRVSYTQWLPKSLHRVQGLLCRYEFKQVTCCFLGASRHVYGFQNTVHRIGTRLKRLYATSVSSFVERRITVTVSLSMLHCQGKMM